ncbi:hypothetical protein [Flavobacterium algoritolerans]|uniref:HNH endonuclease n=1 Tax=Flavobacterium algoritolerans TaxID=3041254 RepID=A0ABT6V842_9FLAO|nr:hypothetical protein [Flavobacterium algoritolerans]MDI5894362.1 hypothetical protein [Flavobacterium algoritolerans]
MEYRYHPIIESLKISEDGSEILMNGSPVTISSDHPEHMRNPRKLVRFGKKNVNVIRLVCEAWHGISPTGEHAARRVDEEKGDHYSNLFWGKKGMTLSSAKGVVQPTLKMTPEVYANVMKRSKKESIRAILKELDISENRFYQYRKKHVEKDK